MAMTTNSTQLGDVEDHPPVMLSKTYKGERAYMVLDVCTKLRLTKSQFVERAINNEMARLGRSDWLT